MGYWGGTLTGKLKPALEQSGQTVAFGDRVSVITRTSNLYGTMIFHAAYFWVLAINDSHLISPYIRIDDQDILDYFDVVSFDDRTFEYYNTMGYTTPNAGSIQLLKYTADGICVFRYKAPADGLKAVNKIDLQVKNHSLGTNIPVWVNLEWEYTLT